MEKHDDEDGGVVTSPLWRRMEVKHEHIRKVTYYLSSQQSTYPEIKRNITVADFRFIGILTKRSFQFDSFIKRSHSFFLFKSWSS